MSERYSPSQAEREASERRADDIEAQINLSSLGERMRAENPRFPDLQSGRKPSPEERRDKPNFEKRLH